MLNKSVKMLMVIVILMVTFSACGIKDGDYSGSNKNQTDGVKPDRSENPSDLVTFKAEVIEGGVSLLVAPDKESNEYKSSDKISVNLYDCKITDKEGATITKEMIKPGDYLTITYEGVILESYPAQITASAISVVDHNQLIEGYLAIIEDIYEEDAGLNSDIEMIAFDTQGWVGMDDLEKEAVFSVLKDKYEVDIVEDTYDSLVDKGLIDKDKLYFEKGILITISKVDYDKEKQEISYSVAKWRSGLGAVGSDDAVAKYDKEGWKITKNNTWIS